MMDIENVVSSALTTKQAYDKYQNTTDELYQMKRKLDQLITIVESTQLLYKQRDRQVFDGVVPKATETIQHCKKVLDNTQGNFLGLIKTANFNMELRLLANEIGDIIKEFTLAVVTWNALGGTAQWTPKVTLVGPSGGGKSNFLTAWQKREYKPDNAPTIGAGNVKIAPSPQCQIDIWDTAGQQRYMGLTNMYIKGASVVLVCFSLTDIDHKKSTPEWYDVVRKGVSPGTVVALVGTKLDLVEQERSAGKLSTEWREWGQKFAAYSNIFYFEVSAKTGENIEYCVFKLFSRMRPPGANLEIVAGPSASSASPSAGPSAARSASPSSNAASRFTVSLSGYLHKVPGDRKNKIGGWQERFFVCNTRDAQNVYYYRSNNDYRRNKFAGKISLTDVRSAKEADDVTKKSHSFIVNTQERTWYFYAKDANEKKKWLELFRQAIS